VVMPPGSWDEEGASLGEYRGAGTGRRGGGR